MARMPVCCATRILAVAANSASVMFGLLEMSATKPRIRNSREFKELSSLERTVLSRSSVVARLYCKNRCCSDLSKMPTPTKIASDAEIAAKYGEIGNFLTLKYSICRRLRYIFTSLDRYSLVSFIYGDARFPGYQAFRKRARVFCVLGGPPNVGERQASHHQFS